MEQENTALANADQIEALADQLSECADGIHARVMKAIKLRQPGDQGQEINQATAMALFESELLLRQGANKLYLDAAASVISNLAMSQKNLIDLTRAAQQKIAKITWVGDLINISADLVLLAAAVSKGQATAVDKTLKKLSLHSNDLKKHQDTVQASVMPLNLPPLLAS